MRFALEDLSLYRIDIGVVGEEIKNVQNGIEVWCQHDISDWLNIQLDCLLPVRFASCGSRAMCWEERHIVRVR